MARDLFLLCLVSVGMQFWVAPVASAAEVAEQPGWFKEAMAREKKVRRTSKLKLPNDILSGRMPGKFEDKPVKADGSWYFSSNIGTEAPFECAFFEEPLDVAYATDLLANNVIESMTEAVGPLQAKELVAASVDHVEGLPVLSLEWIYSVGPEDSAQVGLAKVRSTPIGDTTLLCSHNELGYRSTFERAFETLVASAKGVEPEPAYYEALYIQSVNDQPIGFVQTTFKQDADGDTQAVVVDASLIPVDSQTLSTSDSTSVDYSTPQGELINALSSSSENGELVVNLELRPVEAEGAEQRWSVTGEFQGKPLDMTIDSAVAPISELGNVLATADLQRSTDRNSVTMTAWLPDVDPTSFLPVDLTLNESDRSKGQMEMSGIDMQMTLDRSGNVVDGVGDMGPARFAMKRVWERGQIPAPQK